MIACTHFIFEDENGKFHKRFYDLLGLGNGGNRLCYILLENFADETGVRFLINMNKDFIDMLDVSTIKDHVKKYGKKNVVAYGNKAIISACNSFDSYDGFGDALSSSTSNYVYLFSQNIKKWRVYIKNIDDFVDLKLMYEVSSAFDNFTCDIKYIDCADPDTYKIKSLFDGEKDITKLCAVVKDVLNLGNNEKVFAYVDHVYGRAVNVKNIFEEVKVLMECENLEDSILKKLTGKELKKFKV